MLSEFVCELFFHACGKIGCGNHIARSGISLSI
jgi:hypothetical protein